MNGVERCQIPVLASMEPRSFKRGNAAWEAYEASHAPASMEPRSFKRGNALRYIVRCCGNMSFNGATFIQTWKHFSRKIQPSFSFEASMEPRSFKRGNQSAQEQSAARRRASMEPRSFKRGNVRDARRLPSGDGCFNGATFIQTWKLSEARIRCLEGAASMEPRSFKRGNTNELDFFTFSPTCFNGATFIQTWKRFARWTW